MPYVYVLRSAGGQYYIGSTLECGKRLKYHKGGYTPSTKRMGKVDLILSQEYKTLKETRNVEKKLKRLKRRDYIEKIVRDGIIHM